MVRRRRRRKGGLLYFFLLSLTSSTSETHKSDDRRLVVKAKRTHSLPKLHVLHHSWAFFTLFFISLSLSLYVLCVAYIKQLKTEREDSVTLRNNGLKSNRNCSKSNNNNFLCFSPLSHALFFGYIHNHRTDTGSGKRLHTAQEREEIYYLKKKKLRLFKTRRRKRHGGSKLVPTRFMGAKFTAHICRRVAVVTFLKEDEEVDSRWQQLVAKKVYVYLSPAWWK